MSAGNYAGVPLMAHPGVTLVAQPAVMKTERKSYKRTLYWLGFIEIILGVSATLLGTTAMVIVSGRSGSSLISSSGIWCGLFLVISGALACRIRKQSAASFVNGSMAMSIIASIFMGIMLLMAIIGLAMWSHTMVMSALFILLCVLSIAGLMLTIVHAAFCCATVCCVRRSSRSQVLYSPMPAPQQLVQLPSGQYMLLQGQPLVPPPYDASAAVQIPGLSTASPQMMLESSYREPKPTDGNLPPPYTPQGENENATTSS